MLLICVSGFFTSCQDTIPNRAQITPDQFINTPDPVCDDSEELVTNADGTKECKAKAITRPTDALKFKPDFCGCKDGKPVTFGNCSTFCADKNTSGTSILYASFNVTEAISLSGLENVAGFCTIPLTGDTANPKCLLEVKDEAGTKVNLDVTVTSQSNSIKVDISALSEDKTYIATLFEQNSKAKSDSIQFIKDSTQTSVELLGTLKVAPISQFTCVIRNYEKETAQSGAVTYWYTAGYRRHYYYLPRNAPDPLQGLSKEAFCHDVVTYGAKDDATFPRLENIPGIFNFWDTQDPRFYDNNGNGVLDINDVIVQKTKNFGGSIPSNSNFFAKFSGLQLVITDPNATSTSTTASQPALGYYMAPWIDTSTSSYRSFCLTSTQYNSATNALYKAFRDVIGVDTEGIYIAEKGAQTIETSNGTNVTTNPDYLLIRESDLKSVWFYVKNNVLTKPTEENVANVTTYFYYPLNKAAPFVKSSTQELYRIRSAAELTSASSVSSSTTTTSGSVGSFPPHDKKIGCIPKL